VFHIQGGTKVTCDSMHDILPSVKWF